MGASAQTGRPRILITGFTPFPGAPVNPTEHLVRALADDPGDLASLGELHLDILPVEYAAVPGRLEALGRDRAPDIAIHFGLSAKATGFTLERLARNANATGRADNAGLLPPAAIFEGDADLPATLPLDAIAHRLDREGLPVAWSDDAGGYLCNYTFYLACSPRFAAFAPAMTGFIHVPPLAGPTVAHPHAMALDDLVRGATLIVAESAAAWSPVT